MSLPLDPYECLKEAKVCFEMANAATSAELKDQYVELAKHYTELAGAIERLIELRSELEKVRNALTGGEPCVQGDFEVKRGFKN